MTSEAQSFQCRDAANVGTRRALSDFNGKDNTAAIIAGYTEYGVSMDARDMCSVLNTFNAWYVGFSNGDVSYDFKDDNLRVRFVRDID